MKARNKIISIIPKYPLLSVDILIQQYKFTDIQCFKFPEFFPSECISQFSTLHESRGTTSHTENYKMTFVKIIILIIYLL